MKKWRFYFKDLNNGKLFDEYIKANSFEEAVEIADARENAEIDVDRTVRAFFKGN